MIDSMSSLGRITTNQRNRCTGFAAALTRRWGRATLGLHRLLAFLPHSLRTFRKAPLFFPPP